MVCRAVIFDYIGTLVNCRNYTMDASKQNLHKSLVEEGFDVDKEKFLAAYDVAHEKYRKVRYGQLREVTNAVWVAEALCNLGFKVSEDDPRVKAALNVFFQDFIDTLELRKDAKRLVNKSLRKMGISESFNLVVVSEEVGWRKPSAKIFQTALNKLQIEPFDVIYIGDSPIEDIKGAKQAGLKTVFVPSQFNTLKDLKESKQEPDFIAKDLATVCQSLDQILSSKGITSAKQPSVHKSFIHPRL
jgi:FMN phosphatase YigB (HAD superfamily)